MGSTGPEPEELAKAQRHALKAAQISLDTPDAVATAIGQFTRLGGPVDLIDTWYANYSAVTVEDIRRLVTETFVPEALTVALLDVTPPEGALPDVDSADEVTP